MSKRQETRPAPDVGERPAGPAGSNPGKNTGTDAVFRADLVAIIPSLRAFARGLCGNRDLADDLAQEALAKAWSARASYTQGTNFRAWIFRILRNHFYTVATLSLIHI